MKLTAILWDYDGTLMDSRHKNLSVNKEIFTKIKPEFRPEELPVAFSSVDDYQKAIYQSKDWIELYTEHLGLTDSEAMQAGSMWTEYHMKNHTEVTLFDGIPKVVKYFETIPQGICSLNTADNIVAMLKQNNIDHCFNSIIGFDTTSEDKPKPHPESFLKCLDEMEVGCEGTIVYIGDHEEDVRFARNAESTLKMQNKNVRVYAIAAAYAGVDLSRWELTPDFIAHSTNDIIQFALAIESREVEAIKG